MIINFLRKILSIKLTGDVDRSRFGGDRMRRVKKHSAFVKEFSGLIKDIEEYLVKAKDSGESSKYFSKGLSKKTPRDIATEIFTLLEIPVPMESVPIPSTLTPEIWNNDEAEVAKFLTNDAMKGAAVLTRTENVLGGRFAGMKRERIMGIYKISDIKKPIFCAHLDVVGKDDTFKTQDMIKAYKDGEEVIIVREGLDGYSRLLGADDRAGVQIIYNMIKAGKDVNYIITNGEESSGIGSNFLIGNEAFLAAIKDGFIVCLDRKGDSDLLDKRGVYCNADLFDAAIEATKIDGKEQLFKSDAVWCDADVFCTTGVPCLNMSVGYQNAHSGTESMVMKWFDKAYANALNMEANLRGPFERVVQSKEFGGIRFLRDINIDDFLNVVDRNPKMTVEEYLKILKKNERERFNKGVNVSHGKQEGFYSGGGDK